MIRYIFISIFLAFTVVSSLYGQSKLTFTATYTATWHKFDSVNIHDLNTGSTIMKHYPDTVLKLLITGNDEFPAEAGSGLSQNYPNPFTDKTSFDVTMDKAGLVNLNISDLSGRSVINYSRYLIPGKHTFFFTGGTANMYIVSLRSPFSTSSIKMIHSGQYRNGPAALEYAGSLASDRGVPRSGNKFEFNTGDELEITGYMTDLAGSVVRDTINDAPDRSRIYTLSFEQKKRILILMYHKIADSIPDDIYVRTPADFENDLIYFRDHQYQVLAMDDLPAIMSGEIKLSANAVIMTFDDGYESNYTKAFPLLTSYRMPATFFLTAEWIGTTDFTTWSQVWLMSQYQTPEGLKPFVMGSHTSSHPYLEKSDTAFATHADYLNFLNTELTDSKNWISDVTGQTGMFLSLPYGDGANNPEIIAVAKSNGYTGIRTSVWSSIDPDKIDLFSLPSLPILSDTPINSIEEYFNY
jgi:peptidoglycan/xylan/chitin deacetylase (PgdA/CDA1 family)